MAEKIFPKGISVFPPRQGAPSFVKGSVLIIPNDLVQFLKENPNYLGEYKEKKQLRLDLMEGDKGLYLQVNTFGTPAAEVKKEAEDDLPF